MDKGTLLRIRPPCVLSALDVIGGRVILSPEGGNLRGREAILVAFKALEPDAQFACQRNRGGVAARSIRVTELTDGPEVPLARDDCCHRDGPSFPESERLRGSGGRLARRLKRAWESDGPCQNAPSPIGIFRNAQWVWTVKSIQVRLGVGGHRIGRVGLTLRAFLNFQGEWLRAAPDGAKRETDPVVDRIEHDSGRWGDPRLESCSEGSSPVDDTSSCGRFCLGSHRWPRFVGASQRSKPALGAAWSGAGGTAGTPSDLGSR